MFLVFAGSASRCRTSKWTDAGSRYGSSHLLLSGVYHTPPTHLADWKASLARPTSFSSVQSHLFGASMYLLRLMFVGVWLGLLWVLFYFFDHYIQSSVCCPCVAIQHTWRELNWTERAIYSAVLPEANPKQIWLRMNFRQPPRNAWPLNTD